MKRCFFQTCQISENWWFVEGIPLCQKCLDWTEGEGEEEDLPTHLSSASQFHVRCWLLNPSGLRPNASFGLIFPVEQLQVRLFHCIEYERLKLLRHLSQNSNYHCFPLTQILHGQQWHFAAGRKQRPITFSARSWSGYILIVCARKKGLWVPLATGGLSCAPINSKLAISNKNCSLAIAWGNREWEKAKLHY